MTLPPSTITLDVDLANPGQFLACCGLLELASRLDAEALGWFRDAQFHLSLRNPERLNEIKTCDLAPISLATDAQATETEEKSPPIQLGSPFNWILDWWEDPAASRAGFKTWAGGQTVIGFMEGMRRHLSAEFWREPFETTPIAKPKPFYFDSRISRLTSLDLGFSAEKFVTAFSPAVELFSMVGLQRFRPTTILERERYCYATWKNPLPTLIAAAVAAGLIATLIDRRYRFPLVVRTGGKYKAFGPATLERRFHDDSA